MNVARRHIPSSAMSLFRSLLNTERVRRHHHVLQLSSLTMTGVLKRGTQINHRHGPPLRLSENGKQRALCMSGTRPLRLLLSAQHMNYEIPGELSRTLKAFCRWSNSFKIQHLRPTIFSFSNLQAATLTPYPITLSLLLIIYLRHDIIIAMTPKRCPVLSYRLTMTLSYAASVGRQCKTPIRSLHS